MVDEPSDGERRVGRPRTFERDAALLAAARLFWARGYSGTSTRALSAELGMSTSSIYAAFGSKAGLYEEAVRTYAERYRTIYQQACAQRSFTMTLERLFRESVVEFTQPEAEHPGCLISSAAMSDTAQTLDVRAYIAELHAANEAMVRDRIEQAQSDGQVTPDTAPAVLARLVQTLWHGLSHLSNQGVSRTDLQQVADLAVGAMPWILRGVTEEA